MTDGIERTCSWCGQPSKASVCAICESEAAREAFASEAMTPAVALREIVRLRLATDEGSLRVRADRMWDIANAALAASPSTTGETVPGDEDPAERDRRMYEQGRRDACEDHGWTPVDQGEVERLREAARAAHDTLIELNPRNYTHDDVCEANDAAVEAILLLADALGETHGKTTEWWAARRAALSPSSPVEGEER